MTINDQRECAAGTAFPFIVKVDIEGAEADVFSKNTEWLSRTRWSDQGEAKHGGVSD